MFSSREILTSIADLSDHCISVMLKLLVLCQMVNPSIILISNVEMFVSEINKTLRNIMKFLSSAKDYGKNGKYESFFKYNYNRLKGPEIWEDIIRAFSYCTNIMK